MPNLHLPVPVGVGIIAFRGGEVLLGLRQGSHGSGLWACPGGKPEPGEHPYLTAFRELEEETGIKEDDVLFGPERVNSWHYDIFPDSREHYVTIYYTIDVAADTEAALIEPEKCAQWGWFHVDDALGFGSGLPNNLWSGTGEAIRIAWRQFCE